MADGYVIVGKDATVYTYAPYGADLSPSLGSPVSMLARFKEITLKMEFDWEDVTASSNGGLKERRKLNEDWTATLKNQVRTGGDASPVGPEMMLSTDTIQVVFQAISSGKTWTLYGGLKSGETMFQRGEQEETMEITNVGPIDPTGTTSIILA